MVKGIGGKVNTIANLDNLSNLVNMAIGNLSTPDDRNSVGATLAREKLIIANEILNTVRDAIEKS